MKTHSGAKKRFSRTKKGKLKALHTSDRHEQVRRRKGHPTQDVAPGQAKRITRMLAPNRGR